MALFTSNFYNLYKQSVKRGLYEVRFISEEDFYQVMQGNSSHILIDSGEYQVNAVPVIVWVIVKYIAKAFISNGIVYAVSGETIGGWAIKAVDWLRESIHSLLEIHMPNGTTVSYAITTSGCVQRHPSGVLDCPY